MYKVKLRKVAFSDLQKAKDWYNNQRPKLGDEFKRTVNKEIDIIALYPLHYQVIYKNLRVAYLNRFPYGIFYLVQKRRDQIIIIGVLHTKRDPKIVSDRI